MRRPGIRAWRFVHPDLDVPAGETSLPGQNGHPPWQGLQLTPRGGVELISDNQAVRQAILLLLSTRPGERVMRPEYGCYLHQLVFAPNDATTAGIAVYYVRRALQQWEPRVDIVRLDANRDPDNPGQLIITLEYQVRATSSRESLELSLDLAGG